MMALGTYMFRRAEYLSPVDLLQRAAAITVVFLIVRLAGFREYTGIVNGTIGSMSLGWSLSAFLGLIYIAFYLAFIVVAPTLILAAGMLMLWERVMHKKKGEATKSYPHPGLP